VVGVVLSSEDGRDTALALPTDGRKIHADRARYKHSVQGTFRNITTAQSPF
jgi:hypothetical protein